MSERNIKEAIADGKSFGKELRALAEKHGVDILCFINVNYTGKDGVAMNAQNLCQAGDPVGALHALTNLDAEAGQWLSEKIMKDLTPEELLIGAVQHDQPYNEMAD